MILKGIPDSFKPFAVHVTQSDTALTFMDLKTKLRSFEETEKFKIDKSDNVMKAVNSSDNVTGARGRPGTLLVDCGATSHIVTDITKFVSFDESFCPEEHYMELADGTREKNTAKKRGTARLFCRPPWA
ncbi:hypothetical protein HOLleu_40779 [Holothuria leucospilota]|uniref:Uncharacterized protein n=1 Tax=Holothuria leucospilota TaxID=206669 RepID=A0A9Q0YEP2_HOLLE|nr:hypothetical protein HOLleu_40779 [Holothuria leucospilota]